MQKTSLISLRLDNETLKWINDQLEKRPHFNRSTLLNHLLTAMIKCSADGAADKILKSQNPYDEGIVIITNQIN